MLGALRTQHALDSVMALEERSRGFVESVFTSALADYAAHFGRVVSGAQHAQRRSLATMARVLDDSDALAAELSLAQGAARAAVGDRDALAREVGDVCELATGVMRDLEFMTTSAAWRRAVLETKVPDEIAVSVTQLRGGVAEVVHRSKVISKRAARH